MANVSHPHFSNSPLSLSSLIFTPENNPIPPSLHSSLSLSESEFSFSDSDHQPCDFDLEMDPKVEALSCDYPQMDDNDQVSFLKNLFHRSSDNDRNSDCSLRLGLGSGGSEGIGDSSEVDLELGLGLGLGLHSEVNNSAPSSQSMEETRRFEGLRVANVDSESDCDDGFLCDFDEIDDGFGGVSDFDRPPFCWDYLGFNNGRSNSSDSQLGRMDGDSQIYERDIELPGIESDDDDGGDYFFGRCHDGFDDDVDGETQIQLDRDEREREAREVSNLFDTYQERAEQEIMIQSDTDEGVDVGVEEAIRDLEWEILLAVNNFNREVYDMDFNVDMYEAILGEVEERMNEWRGSPPAAVSIIENLPTVCVSAQSLKDNDVVCAICKDDILGEEIVRQLPCSHYYHGDCIVPWLKIRNTCPVCRYELPTDDPEYECRKREGEGMTADGDVSLNLQASGCHNLVSSRLCFLVTQELEGNGEQTKWYCFFHVSNFYSEKIAWVFYLLPETNLPMAEELHFRLCSCPANARKRSISA